MSPQKEIPQEIPPSVGTLKNNDDDEEEAKMQEAVLIVFLPLTCIGVFAMWRLCSRMLSALERVEAAVRALGSGWGEPAGRADAEQERYEQGVANILAYGTREMVRRRGDAQ